MSRWEIITGEYPPQPGGVADYTRLVARGLMAAADEVAIHAPASSSVLDDDEGLRVNRLPGRFGRGALAQLDRRLDRRAHILVQYVPHAFGRKAMNLPFCAWLYRQRHHDVTVMFHEVAYPIRRGQSMRRNGLGATHRMMAALVARSARRILVAAEAWRPKVRRFARADCPILWAPVPSNIRVVDDPEAMKSTRLRYASRGEALIGHFRTFGAEGSDRLRQALRPILENDSAAKILLIGRGSEEFRATLVVRCPSAAGRVYATGSLDRREASISISACDAMLQPFEGGITSRNASAIAALAHARPIVTNIGPFTENMWNRTAAVLAVTGCPRAIGEAALELVSDRERSRTMGCAGAELYREVFDVRHTVNLLRGTSCES